MDPRERLSEELIQICNAYAKHHAVKLYELIGVIECVKHDFFISSVELADDTGQGNNNHFGTDEAE
jgi:hypothetical protein